MSRRPRAARRVGRRAPALVLVAGLVTGVLAGCTGDQPATEPGSSLPASPSGSSGAPPEATASAPSAAPVPLPADRACYRMTYEEAVAPTTRTDPVPCSREHTSMTYAVGRLDAVVGGHLLAVDSERVQAEVAERCPARLLGFLGGDRESLALSMLRAVWFTPTVEESDGGADWFRCDVVALAAPERLAPLTGRLAGVLDRPAAAEQWAMCGTAGPDSPDFRRVLCSAPHDWRAVAVVDLAGAAYPGEGAARSAGQGPCEDAGRAVAEDPLSFEWGYEWPTEEQWEAGMTFGRCWAPD
ncbi:septum formation family protein [Nocardioides sp. SYSU DS0663]|uniref:septum formation family protein n=1 Tax=Nocardioides sp. SYSU DS0663 TaxID=3416445 RepID=UPI003F4C5186